MASGGLLYPQVNADLDAVEDKMMGGKYRPDDPNELESPISRISEVWPELPLHGRPCFRRSQPDYPA
jgi:hypothetical protein